MKFLRHLTIGVLFMTAGFTLQCLGRLIKRTAPKPRTTPETVWVDRGPTYETLVILSAPDSDEYELDEPGEGWN